MSLRSERSSGMCVIVIGVLIAGFSLISLTLLTLQMTFARLAPNRPDEGAAEFDAAMNAVHGVWWTHMPCLFAGGLIFAVAGYSIRRGSALARRVAQMTAFLGYVWIVSYVVACLRAAVTTRQNMPGIPEYVLDTFLWGGAAMTALIGAFFPTVILYCLWRPKSQAPLDSDN